MNLTSSTWPLIVCLMGLVGLCLVYYLGLVSSVLLICCHLVNLHTTRIRVRPVIVNYDYVKIFITLSVVIYFKKIV